MVPKITWGLHTVSLHTGAGEVAQHVRGQPLPRVEIIATWNLN